MIVEASKGVMNVGHQLDDLATVISFPVSDVENEYGAGGTFYVRIQRNGDVAAYPTSNFSVSNGKLNLILTASDMAVNGEGQIQLRYSVGSVTKMSRIYKFFSHYSLDASAEVPDPWVSWVEAVEDNADRAEAAVAHYPHIDPDTNHWMQWDAENEEWIDTGIDAEGYSPSASVEKVGNKSTITITDKEGTTSADVYDGEDGEDGEDGTDGVTFTPSVSDEGVISWANDGGRENPEPRNIRGPAGPSDWDDITNKPDTFPPSPHNHDDRYYTESEVDDKVAELQPKMDNLLSTTSKNVVGAINELFTSISNHISDAVKHITSAERTAWNGKQDAISDLSSIRSGANAGATALQPSALNSYRTAAEQNIIDNGLASGISNLGTIVNNFTIIDGKLNIKYEEAQ